MKKLPWLIWSIANFLPLLAHAANIANTETLTQFLKELRTLQAHFEQKLYSEKGKLLETSQGQMFIQRPNQFRWNYQQPYQQLIVADQKKIWIYDQDLDQVTIRNLDKALGSTPALLLSSGNKLEEDFFITPLSAHSSLSRFDLRPKDAQAQFTSIRITLQGQTLQSLELEDNLSQRSVIIFNQIKRNEPLDEGLFIFTPPAGADIVEDK